MKGLSYHSTFPRASEVELEERIAKQTSVDGEVLFERKVEFPKSWSQNATNIVASKYFAKEPVEWTIGQMLNRVVNTISDYGDKNKYFDSEQSCKNFNQDLKCADITDGIIQFSGVVQCRVNNRE